MQSATVSGVLTYTELVMAAKNEEQQQVELKKEEATTGLGLDLG